jgi:hypothetical protein
MGHGLFQKGCKGLKNEIISSDSIEYPRHFTMCQFSSTEEQRKTIINAIMPVAHHIQDASEYPYPIMYRCVNTNCGHREGTCNVDKDNFVEAVLQSIESKKWSTTKKLFHMWDKMLSHDLINSKPSVDSV